MAERRDYDALAQDIDLEDITSCEGNANILRMLRDGDPNWNKFLYIMNEEQGGEVDPDEEFAVREGDDMGWLGYFIGRSEVIEDLQILHLPEGGNQINRFLEGMSRNLSLKTLRVANDIGFDGWSRLGNFLENNRNIACFEVEDVVIGQESAQTLALTLGRMQRSSLKHLSVNDTGLSDEGLTELATGLRLHSQLEHLYLYNNNIGRDGCIALGNTLSRWPASNKLETLYLFGNVIDDGGLQALVSGVMNCCSLKQLYLGGNRSITAAGLRSLFPLLQSESHSLEKLHLHNYNFRDDGAMILAEGLTGNKSLKQLYFDVNVGGITAVGWSAFSRLLCDTSKINNTYLSNHTLTNLGAYDEGGTPEDIQRLLTTNTYENRQGAAICKILRSHPDLDMEPFFKLKMQLLPVVISWFDRVEPIEDALITSYDLIDESERHCQKRKLSALYKFVRAMPDLAVTGYWEGRMIHIEAQKRKLDDEMLRIADERRRLENEEKFTLERLGDRPMDEAEAEVNRNKRMRHE